MENKTIIIYGFHAVDSAIINDTENVLNLWIEKKPKNKRIQQTIELAEKYNVSYKLVDATFLDEQVTDANHQGVAIEYKNSESFNELYLPEILKKENVFILILDGITDPHNLGACLRSANAAGVDAVIAPKDRAAGLTPTVRKIASGAEQTTPFIQVTNISQTLKNLKDNGVWCFGLAGEAEMTLYEADFVGKVAIVMGGEEKGLRRLTRENCDSLIKIPMKGSVESLNVSVATGVTLFEALRQRR